MIKKKEMRNNPQFRAEIIEDLESGRDKQDIVLRIKEYTTNINRNLSNFAGYTKGRNTYMASTNGGKRKTHRARRTHRRKVTRKTRKYCK